MATLAVYYNGREIGLLRRWRQKGKTIILEANTLGLLEGMVIEVSRCDDKDNVVPTEACVTRVGALVGEVRDSGILIQLDELGPLGT